MFRSILKTAAMMAFVFLLMAGGAMASSKMEVSIGDTVDLSANSSLISPVYKWNVTKDNRILNTQGGRTFSYKFEAQGEYIINLTSTGSSSIENSTIYVLVGDKYENQAQSGVSGVGSVVIGNNGEPIGTVIDDGSIVNNSGQVVGKVDDKGQIVSTDGSVIADAKINIAKPLKVTVTTLPPMDLNSKLTILGDSGKAQFNLEGSYGDIVEYRIDKNIYKDSDSNGVANDDIDNSGDNSYLTGANWSTQYAQGETPKTVAEITLVDKNGNKAKKQIEVLFEKLNTSGALKAVLQVLPATDQKDNLVHLYDNPHKVSFYARKSEGEITEYRIDKNIFEDSDSDGDPANDIDNINDISFKTGDVWQASYQKTDQQIIAQLIVVSAAGKGSRVQKGLVFGDKPAPVAPTMQDADEALGIRLTADKEYVVKGDPIIFTVKGLQQNLANYSFSWDLFGDGKEIKETEGVNSLTYIYDQAGVFNPKVAIADINGNSDEKKLQIIVKDTLVTKADFSFETDGNTIKFTDLSSVAYNLTNKNLTYSWSFGDTDAASLEKQISQTTAQNPIYTYTKKGKYVVTLTVSDADNITDSRSSEVEIENDLKQDVQNSTPEAVDQPVGEGSSLMIKILKMFLYLILIVIALTILIVGGFLVFLKIQSPELTFEELIDHFKNKILSMIGAHEDVIMNERAEDHDSVSSVPQHDEIHEAESAPANDETVYPKHPEAARIDSEVGPMPDWLKGTEVVEGTVEEPNSSQPAESESAEPESTETLSDFNEESPAEEVQPEQVILEPETPASEADTQTAPNPFEEGSDEESVSVEPVSTEDVSVVEPTPVSEPQPAEEQAPAQDESLEAAHEEGAEEDDLESESEDTTTSQPQQVAPVSQNSGAPAPFKKKRRRRRHKKSGVQGNQSQGPNQASANSISPQQ